MLDCAIARLVPYAPVLNVPYGLNGYLGFALTAFMMVHDAKGFRKLERASGKPVSLDFLEHPSLGLGPVGGVDLYVGSGRRAAARRVERELGVACRR